MSEITIFYQGQNYVVPLTTDASAFYIHMVGGTPIAVRASAAATLFGAEKAVLLLNRLHTQAGVDQIYSSWNAVVTSSTEVLARQGVENLLAGVSGALVTGALSGGTGISAGLVEALGNAALGITPSLTDLAVISTLISTATRLLATADANYQASIVSSNGPIPFTTIKNINNDTLLALGIGNAASRAAQNIPGLNNSFWDDLVQIFTNLAAPIANLAVVTGSILNSVATQLETNILGVTTTLSSGIADLGTFKNTATFAANLYSELNQIIASSAYGPLTDGGLSAAVAKLAGSAFVQTGATGGVYSIASPATPIEENSGSVRFTITRSDGSMQSLIYISTVADLGNINPNANYYYTGLLNIPVTFAVGQLTSTVNLNINDLNLLSGSESFRLIAQQNSSDPATTYLASTVFTIYNRDPPPPVGYTIAPQSPLISESQGTESFTITRTSDVSAATVYVSTVHDQGSPNPNGNYYYLGLLNIPVRFAVGQSSVIVHLSIHDLGLTQGSETFRLIVQQNPIDSYLTSLASANFTIQNTDIPVSTSTTAGTPVATGLGSITQPVNTTFLLSPYLSLPSTKGNATASIVNFINLNTGPGQLTTGGGPVPANVAIGYSHLGDVGFSTGSTTGSDKIRVYVSYSDGSTSNSIDLTINIAPASTPPTQPISPGPITVPGPSVPPQTQPLVLTDGGSVVLSAANLAATDPSYSDPSQLTYQILAQPTAGFIYDGGQIARSFTQADINAGLVRYRANLVAGMTSDVVDSFRYTVSDPAVRWSAPQSFSFTIKPFSPPTNQQPYLDTILMPTVIQGGQTFLGNSNLHVTDPNPNLPYTGTPRDGAITYTVVNQPQHGMLQWTTAYPFLWQPGQGSYYGQRVTQFTQVDLHNSSFIYLNNFQTSADDHFSFLVSDGFGGTIALTTVTIPIKPRNALDLDIDVGGFVLSGGSTKISPDQLRVYENAPSGSFSYTVTTSPSHGQLLLSGQPTTTFTQSDVSTGKLIYQQNGGQASSDQFTFSVIDNYGNSLRNLVFPISIAQSGIVEKVGVFAPIGKSVAITTSNLDVVDPGLRGSNPSADSPDFVIYTLQSVPTHGSLSLRGSTLRSGGQFTQLDIDDGVVTYTEDGTVTSTDSFTVSARDRIFDYTGNTNSFGQGSLVIQLVGTNGGRVFDANTAGSTVFFSGPGNNWVVGGSHGATVDYSAAPTGVSVNLSTGSASNGFGGTDTLTYITSVIGSSYNDIFTVGAGSESIDGGGGSDTVLFPNASTQYTIIKGTGTTTVSGEAVTATLTNIRYLTFTDKTIDLTIRTSAPPIPSGLVLSPSSGGGVAAPVIIGMGESGDTVTLYADGTFDGTMPVGTGTVASNGTWSVTTAPMSVGAHSLFAIETDIAGNSSATSARVVITVTALNPNPDGSSGPNWPSETTISGGLVEIKSGASAGLISFSGGGTLQLDDSVHFTGKISGFAVPDQLDLRDISFGAGTTISFAEFEDNTQGTLTVSDGAHVAQIVMAGRYVTGQFNGASDGHGGTVITDPPLTAGETDLIMQGLDDTFWVSLSTGTGFTTPQPWIHHGGSFVPGEAQYADVNGNGKTDLIMQGLDNTFWVSLSTGNPPAVAPMQGGSTAGGGASGMVTQPAPSGTTLSGVQADPVANGAADSDVISVPSGDLMLTAQPTPEIFDFSNLSFGNDTIAGFDPTQDAILLSSGLVNSFTTVQQDPTAVAGGTLITLDDFHSITLTGVAPASLSAANFRFV